MPRREQGLVTRLFILIRSLEVGGAERQLVMLLRGLDKSRFDVTVATLYDGGAFRPEIEAIAGVRLLSLGKRGRWDVVPALRRLWMAARDSRPDILLGYMSPGNELCLLLGKLLGTRVVWCLRSSYVDFSLYDWLPSFFFRLSAMLSRGPDLIIANSEAGRRSHQEEGFHGERMIVIRNGIDTSRYRRDPDAGARVRSEWGIEKGTRLVGVVARLDPMKDHGTFLRAASRLAARKDDVRFVCVGGGAEAYAASLRALADAERVPVLWVGQRTNMPAVFSALDLACCSSSGEGFPNAIAEAMSCGVPCVSTDAGDLPHLVGTTGVIVPRCHPAALADGLATMLARLDQDEAACREVARTRVVSEFGVDKLAERTSAALLGILEGPS
jgi:glycosyltransferase involved in cell wall biosynthesis